MGTITENDQTKEMKEKIISMAKLSIKKIPMDNYWLSKFVK